jgi:hypothetical protein
MSISNNKLEITNETHHEVHMRLINSEVALSEPYVLIEFMLR